MQPPNEGRPQPPQQPYNPPQQPYGPPYPQQPMYQPPPPKKRSKAWLWIVLGVLAVLLLGCIGIVALITSAAKTTNTGTLATTIPSSSTSAPTSNPSGQHFKVGQVVTVGDTWQVTVNSAKTSEGEQFITPTAHTRYQRRRKRLPSASKPMSSVVDKPSGTSRSNFSHKDAPAIPMYPAHAHACQGIAAYLLADERRCAMHQLNARRSHSALASWGIDQQQQIHLVIMSRFLRCCKWCICLAERK